MAGILHPGERRFPAVISYHIKSYKKSPRNHLFSDGPGGILYYHLSQNYFLKKCVNFFPGRCQNAFHIISPDIQSFRRYHIHLRISQKVFTQLTDIHLAGVHITNVAAGSGQIHHPLHFAQRVRNTVCTIGEHQPCHQHIFDENFQPMPGKTDPSTVPQ